jgi:hypothetical protein
MTFSITIIHDKRKYRYKVERIEINARNEVYKLTARNKTIIFTNNRPFLKEKNLKHWKVSWKTDPEIWNIYFKKLLVEAIEKEIS